MNPELITETSKTPGKTPGKTSKHNVLKIVGGVFVVIIVVAVILNNTVMSTKLIGAANAQKIATVKKGNIITLVKGSGPIYFTNSNKINSRVSGTIKKINFKVGDKVKAGDVIYEIDDKDAKKSVDITKQGLKQSEVSAGASNEAVSNLSITAPFTGQVNGIAVNVGDTVAPGGVLLTITDTTRLKVLLTFNAADASKISIGETAKVNVTSMMQAVNGTVTYISNEPSSSVSGGKVYTVEIVLNNPGAVSGGMIASADVETSRGSVSSTNTASLSYLNKQAVISKTGGTVQSIDIKQDQKVSSGVTLVQMENSEITRAKEAADIGIDTAQDQIDVASSQLDYYKITSPISGVLSTVNFQVGDTLSPGIEVCEVLSPNQMKFDIPVDELDIAKITPGQKASISVDSIASTLKTPINGEVEVVSTKGVFANGVTTYLVTIKVESNFSVLKGGMNANANVQVINKPNVLYLPIESIRNDNGKNYVLLKSNTGESTEVELGVKNDKYIEVKSGLILGDKVILKEPYSSSAN